MKSIQRRSWLAWLTVSVSACFVLGTANAATLPHVKLSTSMGDIVLELYPDAAPKTVANFLQYVKDKHYDGTIFHRVIGNFMIQGGGFDAAMQEKPTRTAIPNEALQSLERGHKNQTGTIAMARTNDPQSATAQFFINVKDNPALDATPIPPGDPVASFTYQGQTYQNVPRAKILAFSPIWGYAVFGKVISGMDVVNKIRSVPTTTKDAYADVPATPVTILSATIVP